MVKKLNSVLSVLTLAVVTTATTLADTYTTACVSWIHEPEIPAELKKEIK